MKMNASQKPEKVSSIGSAIPAVLVATTIGISLLLQGSISRRIGNKLGSAQAATVQQSATASARLNWDVRLATSVARVSDIELVLNTREGATVVYSFDTAAHTVTRSKGREATTILSDVGSVAFS